MLSRVSYRGSPFWRSLTIDGDHRSISTPCVAPLANLPRGKASGATHAPRGVPMENNPPPSMAGVEGFPRDAALTDSRYAETARGEPRQLAIELELITANGGDRVGALVLSGQVDLGLAGPEVAIYLYNSETPDKPVMFCSVNGTDGFFFVSREKIEPFGWDKLKNRRIIGWRPGSTPQLFFEYVLKLIPKPSRALLPISLRRHGKAHGYREMVILAFSTNPALRT